MKVTFYSNFLTHHQVPFCLDMQKRLGNDFKFVSTVKIFQWRLDMGFKDLDQEYDFVVKAYESDEEYKKAVELASESDIVIIGSTTDDCIKERLKQDKITFRYRARVFIFLDGFFKTIFDKEKMELFYNRHIKYRKNKNLYMLCANAYGANDFNSLGLYKNKIYKWGYFLETNKYDIENLLDKKSQNEKTQIVWVARFINWKHPEIVIKLAKNLKLQNYNFKIKMLGTGKLEQKIKDKIIKENLQDVVEVVGQVPSDKVKYYMEDANIFLGTSDSREGWGAVINESMNAGCTVIANQKMGSVPFLIKHNENGLMYNSYKELEHNVKKVINDKSLQRKFGKNAYEFITEKWTSDVATENLLTLFESIIGGKEYDVKDGPASKATKYKRKKI
ncbi:MAG: glycosyltransferase [Clostridia bacterium]|nr:glycosyltransferase [Clostridia bacterium]